MENIVKITDIQQVTHDVKRFRLEKPVGYHFEPGQATDVSINTAGLQNELRPFTFTCLPGDPFLEFTIKRYPDHHGVTDKLHQLQPGSELIIRDVWGAIAYKGAGYFIAGGAGITPFLAILRHLHKENRLAGNSLFFSNKTIADIIAEAELKAMLGDNAVFITTKEKKTGYLNAYIDKMFLKEHINNVHAHFYVCGPDPMIASINKSLTELGATADNVVFEK